MNLQPKIPNIWQQDVCDYCDSPSVVRFSSIEVCDDCLRVFTFPVVTDEAQPKGIAQFVHPNGRVDTMTNIGE